LTATGTTTSIWFRELWVRLVGCSGFDCVRSVVRLCTVTTELGARSTRQHYQGCSYPQQSWSIKRREGVWRKRSSKTTVRIAFRSSCTITVPVIVIGLAPIHSVESALTFCKPRGYAWNEQYRAEDFLHTIANERAVIRILVCAFFCAKQNGASAERWDTGKLLLDTTHMAWCNHQSCFRVLSQVL